jgi:hypothetical protein
MTYRDAHEPLHRRVATIVVCIVVLAACGKSSVAPAPEAGAPAPTALAPEAAAPSVEPLIRSRLTDEAGNSFVGGDLNGPYDIGGERLTPQGGSDLFVAKYAPNGAVLWARAFGSKDHDGFWSMALTPKGDLYVLGQLEGTGPALSRFGAAGSKEWTTPVPAGRAIKSPQITVDDAAGAVVASCWVSGMVYDGHNPPKLAVARVSLAGERLWSAEGLASAASLSSVTLSATGVVEVKGNLFAVAAYPKRFEPTPKAPQMSAWMRLGTCEREAEGAFSIRFNERGRVDRCRITPGPPPPPQPSSSTRGIPPSPDPSPYD